MDDKEITAEQLPAIAEDIIIEITKNEMEAWATLTAPENGGAGISFEAAKEKAVKAGVVHGLDEQALAELLSDKSYGKSRLIAEATPPRDGENGILTFLFSTDEKTGRPKEIGGGKVDYRTLDLYVPVTEGQLLVSRSLATAGQPGATVKGKPLIQKPGKETKLPRGKNIAINDEKTEISSKCSGLVEFVAGSVNVSSVYMINGDCDLGVGHIDFDGSVQISGNVLSGLTIKASGGVIVGGVVGAAEIIAGGNVEIKQGMQGAGKGRIEAGGAISLPYIERGAAIAGGTITVDASINSILEAGSTLRAKGKRGCIIGGKAGATSEIIANAIGSASNVHTEVEVGITPQKRVRLQYLEKQMEKLSGEMHKLDQLDAYLAKSKDRLDPETYDKLYRSGAENRRTYTDEIEDYTAEINEIKYELDHATEGKVHVFDTVYPGARIIIASDVYRVNTNMTYSTFKFREGQVVIEACEIKQSD